MKVIEFNARFGDPECMNIMALLRGSWTDAMRAIDGRAAHGSRRPARAGGLARALPRLARTTRSAAAASRSSSSSTSPACEAQGVAVHFSSTVQVAPGRYRTVGTSRALALTTSGPSLEQCRERLIACARRVPALEWREDIGTSDYLQSLSRPPTASA